LSSGDYWREERGLMRVWGEATAHGEQRKLYLGVDEGVGGLLLVEEGIRRWRRV
jgi:hypothetical protein